MGVMQDSPFVPVNHDYVVTDVELYPWRQMPPKSRVDSSADARLDGFVDSPHDVRGAVPRTP